MARRKLTSNLIGIAVCTLSTADGDIQLLPAGTFNAPRGAMMGGGPWLLDDATAATLMQRIAQRANDIPVDYEHQTLAASENGKPAPAAGWLNPRNFEWRPGDGLYVKAPDWTETAAAHIQKREYRYLSPVFSYSKNTGQVLDILHVGLTNSPAIDGMEDVLLAAAKNLPQQPEEPQMDEELLKLLGLDAKASEEEAIAALKAFLDEKETLVTSVDELKQELQKKDEAIAAAKSGGDSSMEAITGLQTQVAALTQQIQGGEMDTLIAAAKAEGKLIPAQEKWARSLGVDKLKDYLGVAQPIAALKSQQTTTAQKVGDDGKPVLDDEQLAVCRQMNISPEDFQKSLQQEA